MINILLMEMGLIRRLYSHLKLQPINLEACFHQLLKNLAVQVVNQSDKKDYKKQF